MMDENLPEKTPDAALSPAGSGSAAVGRELSISGGEVYLPASRTVKPGDDEFRRIVTETMPEIAPSLAGNALGRSPGYSITAVLLILLFLGGAFAMLWYGAPRPEKLARTVIAEPEPEQVAYRGRFAAEFAAAKRQIENRQFSAARQTLEPVVDILLKADGFNADDNSIFYDYFKLFDRLDWDDGARARLAKLIELAPDDCRWQLFDILSHPALARRGGEFRRPNDRKLNFNPEGIIARRKEIDSLRRRRPELARQLDLCKCYFALNLWRLKNHDARSAQVGEEDREEAWEIAEGYGDDRDFLKVRRHIVVGMLEDSKGKFIGRYKFGGNVYISKDKLDKELHTLRRKLKKP